MLKPYPSIISLQTRVLSMIKSIYTISISVNHTKTHPVVLINHSLTGDANVAGPKGWWSEVVGPNLTIDTLHFSILAFNIPETVLMVIRLKITVTFTLVILQKFFPRVANFRYKKTFCSNWWFNWWWNCLGDGGFIPEFDR